MSAARPQHLFPLFADIQTLSGVGPKTAPLLERAMGGRIKDLLLTAPTGAIDRSNRPGIANALAGEIGTFLVTVGSHKAPSNRNRPYKITVYDNSGEMEIIYFKARAAQMEQLLPEGKQRLISGKTESFNAQLQMTHPDYVLDPQKSDSLPLIEPLYPLTAGLSQKMAGKTVRAALSVFETVRDMGEWLDSSFVSQQNWSGFQESLKTLHSPSHAVDINAESPIRRRLAYDELFAKQLAIALVRESTRRAHGREFRHDGHYVQDVLKAAPFKPTGAQSRAFEEIKEDMQSPFRMARLLQGDVGAGKTFVAALAAAYAAEAGVQTALMAPTEILARQHAETLSALLEPAGLTVQAITGRDKGKARQALNSGLEAGYIDVVVGTHALFQDTMAFKDLGLVIIDEQHRFGVRDRLRLANKGQAPDLLVMTATPIPRTLALTSYGDLDSVKLDEKPAGRKPIETRILPLQRLDDVIDGIGRQIQEGNQVYWVCPLVEESELVDPPDATIIVIEHAERFGLAQLHQLRGRVGRSDKQSSCLLLYKGPLSVSGKARLEVMRESEDGFMIAEKDWELRGSGDLLGARQSGLPDYAFANLDKHKSLLETAVQDARLLVQNDPELKSVRGKAARDLLFLFEQDYGIALMRAG